MKDTNLRYTGKPTVRQSFMKEFLVECPKCKKDALVTVENPWFLNEGRLACSNCSHVEKAEGQIRYSVEVSRNCDNCGKHFDSRIPNSKNKVESITIPCPHCGITRTFKPRNSEFRVTYPEAGKATDPVFNLPLWFQTDIKGNLFWAFNRSHLSAIKDYVQSKLRERQTTTHTTMVERLPNFIKESKNREAILKGIEKLEKQRISL